MSSAILLHEKGDQYEDSGLIWAAHAAEETGNWEVFLLMQLAAKTLKK